MGEMFDGENKECQSGKTDCGIDEDDFLLGEGDDERIYVAFYLAGHGKNAGGFVPSAELEQPGAHEHHAGSGRGDGE